MLRISHSRENGKQRLTICGQLAGPWVQELRACWEQCRQVDGQPQVQVEQVHVGQVHVGQVRVDLTVDLSDVTFIDESGERLLSDMRKSGAKFAAGGVATKHLLRNLKGPGERPLRRLLSPCGAVPKSAQSPKGEMKTESNNGEKHDKSA